jgi:hypothetical protein
MAPTAFVIHGRDLQARNKLTELLNRAALDVVPFERIAVEKGASPFVADMFSVPSAKQT